MARLPPRDRCAEVAKHFHGTPANRVLAVLRLGEDALDLFLATLPAGTSRADARALMQRNRHRGRQRSAVIHAINR